MPVSLISSLFGGGGKETALDDAKWLPPAETHERPEVSLPYDLAVQARLRREREAAGEREDEFCLGGKPMSRPRRLLWTLPFFLVGWTLLVWSLRDLAGQFSVIGVILALVGLVAGLISTYVLLGTFNPRLSLLADRDTFAPGEAATIRWRFSTPPRRARSFRVSLQAHEEATYRQGTSDTTATETVFDELRLEMPAGPSGPPTEGTFELALPADAMHSFRSDNNAFHWRLRARAEVPWWPDIGRDVSLRVWSGAAPEPAREEHS